MSKSLNTSLIKEKIAEYGISQSKLSKELDVSRESVSQWLKNRTFPRPSKLLKLGKLLDLKYSELVEIDTTLEPQVAFRKVGSAKTKVNHYKRAKEMGYALEQLVDFLPKNMMIKPPELKKPVNNYEYIQSAAETIRNIFEITDWGIKFDEIISILNSLNVILIPVLLGSKKNHENAIHIYLPKSQTTWIYINLDTKIFDFKFWLSHELGHILTPSLKGKEAEDFSDDFAGAFLFPKELANRKYDELLKLKRKIEKINSLISTASDLIISPITILKEINKYAKFHNLKAIELEENTFYAATTKFTKNYSLVSELLLGKENPTAKKYIKIAEDKFKTKFYTLLRNYDKRYGITSNYIKSVLSISTTDTKEIYAYLKNASN
ncbi:helix-turn-helix domain protein [bacterium BMS3Abin04]|nr:helix-turn-helix domain protein [bacterium BMS3Abin04]